MQTTLTVVDNFLASPQVWRDWALKQDFNVTTQFQGRPYHGYIALPPALQEELEAGVASVLRKPIHMGLAFAKMALKDEPTPTWIHPDSALNSHAGVLYLTAPEHCAGGTAFWTHGETGWDALPAGGVDQARADQLNEQANDSKHWSINGLIGMRFNRFLTYPSNLFHSRYPQEAFGKTYEDGRLIIACFYNYE